MMLANQHELALAASQHESNLAVASFEETRGEKANKEWSLDLDRELAKRRQTRLMEWTQVRQVNLSC